MEKPRQFNISAAEFPDINENTSFVQVAKSRNVLQNIINNTGKLYGINRNLSNMDEDSVKSFAYQFDGVTKFKDYIVATLLDDYMAYSHTNEIVKNKSRSTSTKGPRCPQCNGTGKDLWKSKNIVDTCELCDGMGVLDFSSVSPNTIKRLPSDVSKGKWFSDDNEV